MKRPDQHTVTVKPLVWQRAMDRARAQGRHLSGVITRLLEKWLEGEIDLDE